MAKKAKPARARRSAKIMSRRKRGWFDRDFACRFTKDGHEQHGQHAVHCLK